MDTNTPQTAADDGDDVTSDPAHDDGSGTDWSGEGGATTKGPATETDDVAETEQNPDEAPA